MFFLEPMFTHSAKMAYLLRNKRNEVLWYSSQFILKNIFNNRDLSNNEMIRIILMKVPSKRNLFDIRYLLNHLSQNNFFSKMKEEGNFDLTFQCLKELSVSFSPNFIISGLFLSPQTYFIVVSKNEKGRENNKLW